METTIKMCPICSEPIPNREHAGKYCGAISRKDNVTEICSQCGTNEAMDDFMNIRMTRTFLTYAEEMAKKQMTIVKLNKKGKWHMTGDNYAETWCGLGVGYTELEMMINGFKTDTIRLGDFQAMQERGNKTVCKKCVQN